MMLHLWNWNVYVLHYTDLIYEAIPVSQLSSLLRLMSSNWTSHLLDRTWVGKVRPIDPQMHTYDDLRSPGLFIWVHIKVRICYRQLSETSLSFSLSLCRSLTFNVNLHFYLVRALCAQYQTWCSPWIWCRWNWLSLCRRKDGGKASACLGWWAQSTSYAWGMLYHFLVILTLSLCSTLLGTFGRSAARFVIEEGSEDSQPQDRWSRPGSNWNCTNSGWEQDWSWYTAPRQRISASFLSLHNVFFIWKESEVPPIQTWRS